MRHLSAVSALLIAACQLHAVDRATFDAAALRAHPTPWREANSRAKPAADLATLLLHRVALPARTESSLAYQAMQQRHADAPTTSPQQAIIDRLMAAIPPQRWQAAAPLVLTIVDDPAPWCHSPGIGQIACSSGLVAQRSEPALAFAIAHQIGLGQLGHTRRGHLRHQITDPLWGRIVAATSWAGLGSELATAPAWFSYQPWQHMEADRFAAQTIQLAGYDLDAALDHLRSAEGAPHAALRLARVLARQRGLVPEPHRYGLRRWSNDHWQPLTDGALSGHEPLVLVHGLNSDLGRLEALARELNTHTSRPIVGLRWPNDIDLTTAARLLANELTRTGAGVPDAVGHSAGGLVLRHARELDGVAFDQLAFIATPQRGSDLARLSAAVELGGYLGPLSEPLTSRLQEVTRDGHEELAIDLQPFSQCLMRLHHSGADHQGCLVVRGQALSRSAAVTLRVAHQAAVTRATPWLRDQLDPSLHQLLGGIIALLDIPAEVLNGDLAVTIGSTTLHGSLTPVTVRATHSKLMAHPAVLAAVATYLFPATHSSSE